jgi:hypothetical protein
MVQDCAQRLLSFDREGNPMWEILIAIRNRGQGM